MSHTTQPELLERTKRYFARAITERATHGVADLEAWEEFFDLYNGLLRRFAWRLGANAQETDDLIQEAWSDVIRLLPGFVYDRSRGGFRRWLFRIMRSKAADAGRRRIRCSAPQLLSPSEIERQPAAAREDPARIAEVRFLSEITRVAIDRYRCAANPGEWTVFDQCRLAERPVAEVAAELGITPEAARKRLQRGSAAVRVELARLIGDLDGQLADLG